MEISVGDAVLVDWVDAVASCGWTDETNTEVTKVTAVGIVFSTNDDALTLALNVVAEDGSVNGSIVIPVPWVTKVQVLKRAVIK